MQSRAQCAWLVLSNWGELDFGHVLYQLVLWQWELPVCTRWRATLASAQPHSQVAALDIHQ
jgi:hypothetical protein